MTLRSQSLFGASLAAHFALWGRRLAHESAALAPLDAALDGWKLKEYAVWYFAQTPLLRALRLPSDLEPRAARDGDARTA